MRIERGVDHTLVLLTLLNLVLALDLTISASKTDEKFIKLNFDSLPTLEHQVVVFVQTLPDPQAYNKIFYFQLITQITKATINVTLRANFFCWPE